MGPVTRRWHSNIGLAIAALMLVVAITGIILSFRHWIKEPEPASTEPAAGPVLTMDAAIAAARAHANLPDPVVTELYFANAADGTWCVVFGDERSTEVYMAADGALLKVAVPEKTFTRWMFELHTGEILGPAGPWVSAAGGLALTWLTVSGVLLKLPRRKKAAKSEAKVAS